eukprot:2058532-Prymnesium_polylepis.1
MAPTVTSYLDDEELCVGGRGRSISFVRPSDRGSSSKLAGPSLVTTPVVSRKSSTQRQPLSMFGILHKNRRASRECMGDEGSFRSPHHSSSRRNSSLTEGGLSLCHRASLLAGPARRGSASEYFCSDPFTSALARRVHICVAPVSHPELAANKIILGAIQARQRSFGSRPSVVSDIDAASCMESPDDAAQPVAAVTAAEVDPAAVDALEA